MARLTNSQLEWLKIHFKHTKNAEICERLGISTSYLHRVARSLKLTKSKQFMQKMQANAVQAAQVAIANETFEQRQRRVEQANRNNVKSRFPKGKYTLKNKTAEERAEIDARRVETWKKTRHDDEVMLNWYGEQKTNFRFARHKDPKKNRRLMSIRNYFKRRGYVFTQRAGMCAYYTADTKRSKKVEDEAKELGMLIKIKESQ